MPVALRPMRSALAQPASDRGEVAATVPSFHHGEFALDALVEKKAAQSATIHVVIPARDEEATIGEIVELVRCELMDESPLVDELVVVDDSSVDDTAAVALKHGASVVSGPGLGKGEAMTVGLGALVGAEAAIVVFLDGDVLNFGSHFVTGLVGPLLWQAEIELVKGSYRRPLGDDPSGGGRVTELVAKPALSLCFPELAGLDQPLAGETALRASLLAELELAGGYAVEVALLIDAYRLGGPGCIAQVDLGARRHRNRTLAELAPQARAVLATVLQRAERLRTDGDGRL